MAFLGYSASPYILSLFALGELVNDKLPKTPSRKAPAPFLIRILAGAVCGAALGSLVAGAVGALAGTLGGYELRRRLVQATGGKDLPIALLEDLIAVCAAFWIVSHAG